MGIVQCYQLITLSNTHGDFTMTRLHLLSLLLIGLLSLIGLFLVVMFIEDSRYPDYTYTGPPPDPHREAVLFTWNAAQASTFWAHYQQLLLPLLRQGQDAGEISFVIALNHPSVSHPTLGGQWSQAALVMIAEDHTAETIGRPLLSQVLDHALSDTLVAVDLMRLQPGLDMVYPIRDGQQRESQLVNTAEYVFSQPEARADYYADQYTFSGPAMADLYSRDKAGRFIGFEVLKRIHVREGTPAWDVFHLVGFTRWQTIKSLPFFLSTWSRHARRVYGDDATLFTQLKVWEQIRINVKTTATQHMDMSLQHNQP